MRGVLLLFLLSAGCQSTPAPVGGSGTVATTVSGGTRATVANGDSADPFLWLEDVESPRALAQVNTWNARSTAELQADARYAGIESDTRKILFAEDRIPYGSFDGNYVYNFWQDARHVQGIWRRTTLAEYKKPQPSWDTLLDLDELGKSESQNWVWKGSSCLPPANAKCIVELSRGGADAVELREFDVEKKTFVTGGFRIPDAKSNLSWIDADHIFVSTDFGPGSMTTSGYPRQVRLWERGQPIESAKTVFEADETDVSAGGYVVHRPEGTWSFVVRRLDSVNQQIYSVNKDGGLKEVLLPRNLSLHGIFKGQVLGVLRSELLAGGGKLGSGSLVAWDLKNVAAGPSLIYAPGERESVQGVSIARGTVFVNLMSNVKSRLVRVGLTRAKRPSGRVWKTERVPLPEDGNLAVFSSDEFTDTIMVSYSGFLTPSSVLLMENPAGQARVVRSLAPRFDASQLVSEQYEAMSVDGTKIPYFVVRPKAMKFDGGNVTLLSGYGGFNISRTPFYLGTIGKVFAEKGGVYVVANIRGGGEFGPKWHEAARLKNRQRAFDDFTAVAEDLIKRQITSPTHLGIQGGSNGGLLVAAVFVQHPELFNAVLCEVPLADMLRYHKLLAGASWMGEYGNPDDPEMRPVLRAYSPYQNLAAGKKYPRVFFLTSTRDDRVHPGHARKMAARMEQLAPPFFTTKIPRAVTAPPPISSSA